MSGSTSSFLAGLKRLRPLSALAALMIAAPLLAVPACAAPPSETHPGSQPKQSTSDTYSQDEIVSAASDFFGTTAEAAGTAVQRVFSDYGRPNAYIKGSEAGGAIAVGLRYGEGTLFMKNGTREKVYWQGPSIGWDIGGNGAKVFTLVYNLPNPEFIYRRFPGVDGSAYFIAGIGVNYQRAEGVTLAPMRAGVGLRLGANVGYLAYTKKRHILPF
jgi:hypothetical protein